MASSKRIGFFWGEDKLTLVEFEKNALLKAFSVSLDPKTNVPSPFSSNLTEEIQITAVFQKMLQDHQIAGSSFCVSLPMKEIILRSFVIPFVKPEDVQNAIKFEAKKYLPIDIQNLSYVFYMAPFTENKIKRLQIIFFAVRKEFLDRHERIFKQVNVMISYCEPCVVSLAKFLLFKKEVSPTDHLAFLVLDKNTGRICFIDHGIPQFIREFPLSLQPPPEENKEPMEALSLKIVNEVANSFDFYSRQFNGERIEQMLVSAQEVPSDLFETLEAELKLKIRKISPVVTMGGPSQADDMDTLYAMGACIEPPIPSLSGLNYFEDKSPKAQFKGDIIELFMMYKEIVFVFLICVISLVGVNIFFQVQLKVAQHQYDQFSVKEGAFLNVPADSIQTEIQQNTDKLAAYKSIRTKSDVVLVLLNVASHLPKGAMLKDLNISYKGTDPNDTHVTIDMNGEVFKEDSSQEIKVVNQIFSDFKNDKELAPFINGVTVSLNLEESNGRQVTGFNIHCS